MYRHKRLSMTLGGGLSVILMLVSTTLLGQSVDQANQINEIHLNSDRALYEGQLYFYTGKEALFSGRPAIQQNIIDNIEKGIREGVCQDSPLNRFGDYTSEKLSMHFFQDALYKIRWTFRSDATQQVDSIAHHLNRQFSLDYGPGNSEEFMRVIRKEWVGEKHYLQTFLEQGYELTLEFKDLLIDKKVITLQGQ